MIVLPPPVLHSSSETRGETTASFGNFDDKDCYKLALVRRFERTAACMKSGWQSEIENTTSRHQGNNACMQPRKKFSVIRHSGDMHQCMRLECQTLYRQVNGHGYILHGISI